MPGPVTALEKEAVSAVREPMSNCACAAAMVLAAVAIVSSAFHFWPFDNSKTWQMLCPPNLAVLVWILILVGFALLKWGRWASSSLLPDLSVFAYLSVNVLSMAFATELGRAAIFTSKLALMLVGGYVLFSSAIFNQRSLHAVYGLTVAAATISISYCLLVRFGLGSDGFGFHNNAYKYGTYIGVLVPLCGTYLFSSSKSSMWLLGLALAIGGFVSSGSIGAVAAIIAGMVTSAIIIRKWPVRVLIMSSMVCGIGLMILAAGHPAISALWNDIKPAEKDGVNLKQRYIEWQAEINLLEERSVMGTGAGCINEYRSNFYYRLPKMNTLKAFDQNGWIAAGAETGILGLVCFCWIVVHYFKLAFRAVSISGGVTSGVAGRFAEANLAGLVGTLVANLFSSVHYNGIAIVFVLVLALISRTKVLCGGQ